MLVTSKLAEDAVKPEVKVWVRGTAVYTEVREGGQAVLGAQVSLLGLLEVGEAESRSITALPGVVMADEGGQEPDIEAGDGVYSTFLPSSIPAGRLSLTVQVATGSTATRKDLTPVPVLNRRVPGPVIQLSKPTEAPPGRVRDLAVSLEAGQLEVTWSTPGGDYSRGEVAAQQLVYAASIPELLQGGGQLLYTENRTTEAGAGNSHSLQLPYFGASLHLAVITTDASGLVGAVSNIVTVEVPEVEAEEPDAPRPSMSGLLLVTERDWILMGVVAGALLVLLLSLTASLAYCYCLARAKPPPRAPSTTSTTHEQISAPSSSASGSGDEESLHSEMKSIVAQPALPYHDFVKSLDLSHASSPASTATPLYWSASQLLSKIDSPHPSLDYRIGHYPAPPEFSVTVASLPGEEGRERALEREGLEVGGWHRHRHSGPPPPLYPKPKNVTQV